MITLYPQEGSKLFHEQYTEALKSSGLVSIPLWVFGLCSLYCNLITWTRSCTNFSKRCWSHFLMSPVSVLPLIVWSTTGPLSTAGPFPATSLYHHSILKRPTHGVHHGTPLMNKWLRHLSGQMEGLVLPPLWGPLAEGVIKKWEGFVTKAIF